ncbi:quinone oxidoreductase family protein [Actinocatenispora thailandica]|uniref:quinone oxidoreductase family protein n=1 Tax=Actinocatenispora thailandica TaxID=227318 RepID=UPI00194F5EEA|nr:zinc-binding dehydrogenase [Actinocatenispora thailandica]
MLPRGSWAERIAVRPGLLARIPDAVTDEAASALPVAATTALLALESAGPLIGRRVLITGAAGGVGRFACQLATYAGASVSAVSRRSDLVDRLTADGVRLDGVFGSVPEAVADAGYDVVLDGVGGDSLAVALTALTTDGVCVSFGNGSQQPTRFDVDAFNRTRGARLVGLWLGNVLAADCAPILARLADLVDRGSLHVPLDATLPWTQVATAAGRLTQRRIDGKIVLTVR